MNQSPLTPLDHLHALAQCSLGRQALDLATTADHGWRGYAFQVGDWHCVFPFSNGFEMVSSQDVQPIPWTVHWVRGVTNLGGEIHSVIDFSDFLGLGAVAVPPPAMLLKLPDDQLKSALLLEQGVTLRSFPGHLPPTEVSGISPLLASFVSETLAENEQVWVVLDVDKLCQLSEFVSISNRTGTH